MDTKELTKKLKELHDKFEAEINESLKGIDCKVRLSINIHELDHDRMPEESKLVSKENKSFYYHTIYGSIWLYSKKVE